MKAYHALITGDSGGGKTTLAREVHVEADWTSIWINHNAERVPDGRGHSSATTVQSPSQLREAVAGGYTAINYRTTDATTAIQHARSIGYYETQRPVQIIVDECQSIMPDGCDEENVLKRCLHQDRDMGIRAVLLTQDPSDLDYTPLKQVQFWAWCGPWSGFHDGFLNAHSWIDRSALPTQQYHYVVLNKRGKELYRGETEKRYA